jgi:hypothetical protein
MKIIKRIMKKKYFLLSMIFATFGLFYGCNDAEYDIKDNSLYIAEAASSVKSVMVPIEETTGADINVTIRLAKPVAEDVTVRISIAPSALTLYNEANNTTYASVPVEQTDLGSDANVVIPAGNVTVAKKIHVNYFNPEGKLYALPVAIEGLNNNVMTSVSQSKFIYIVAKKLSARTPNLRFRNNGGCSIQAKPLVVTEPDGSKTGGWNLSLPTYTVECWARLEKYNSQNFAIFSIYGNDSNVPDNYEFYFRFGDANTGPAEPNGSRNYLNWKAWGAQVTGPFELVANQWYHWATVYDGTNLTVYRNGEEYLKTSAKYPGSNWVMHNVEMITSHQNTNNTMNLSQVRIWKKALSPTQIRNNMYYEADATNPDLEAYWKMDEGPDNFNNIFIDATGHGHDAIFYPDRILNFSWTEPQRFD